MMTKAAIFNVSLQVCPGTIVLVMNENFRDLLANLIEEVEYAEPQLVAMSKAIRDPRASYDAAIRKMADSPTGKPKNTRLSYRNPDHRNSNRQFTNSPPQNDDFYTPE
jgi:hypothetical protein